MRSPVQLRARCVSVEDALKDFEQENSGLERMSEDRKWLTGTSGQTGDGDHTEKDGGCRDG